MKDDAAPEPTSAAAPAGEPTDAELLRIVGDERKRSIGFEHDDVLLRERTKALEYFKGELRDVPSLPNRSKAVSTDVADAIETLMADLVPIFTEGDDVMEFVPRGPQDEAQATLESQYVAWVVFQQNPGFLMLSTFFKDALQIKTGVVKWWWEDAPKPKPEIRKGVPMAHAAAALVTGKATSAAPSEPEEDDSGQTQGEALFDLTLPPEPMHGRARIKAWPAEDFTVAADTVWLPEATYCAARSRPRAQELIEQGVDADLVDALPAYAAAASGTEAVQQARDTAGEYLQQYGSISNARLRQVEVVEHYVRLVVDGESRLYRVLTGEDEKQLLDREEVDHLPFAAITPYIVTHRFHGESVADKLMEIVRIKTALMRGGLDSIYFALNQRYGVAEQGASEFTMMDLLDNRPGVPVRMSQQGAVFPLATGGMQFGQFAEGLEYFSTVGEQRTGIVRNAQGLNPDTLHDTAAGAAMLNAAAGKRTRFIARVFAETGVKDLFLGVHRLLRKHASSSPSVRLNGAWETPTPMDWVQRHDVTCDVGVGAGDRATALNTIDRVLQIQEQVVGLPGGAALVTPKNAYAALTDFVSKSGSKKGPVYFNDPATAPPAAAPQDPEAAKAAAVAQQQQQQFQLDQQRLAQDHERAKAQTILDTHKLLFAQKQHADTVALQQRKLDQDAQRSQLEISARQEDSAGKIAAGREKTHIDAAVRTHIADQGAGVTLQVAKMRDQTAMAVQASEAHDAEVMDD